MLKGQENIKVTSKCEDEFWRKLNYYEFKGFRIQDDLDFEDFGGLSDCFLFGDILRSENMRDKQKIEGHLME